VKSVLVSRGWSQQELAAYMGITRQCLTGMLRAYSGNKLETVEAFARVLGVKPQDLDQSYPRRAAARELERARKARKAEALARRTRDDYQSGTD
jgi:transcriptional regulator with XRE-family HTH domain